KSACGTRSARVSPRVAARRSDYAAASSEVQCGHRVAASGIGVAQRGQSLVAAGASGGFGIILLTWRIARNTTKATITKSITALMNRPILMVGAPAALACAMVSKCFADRVMKMEEKSTWPSSSPIGGMMMSLTSELTILPKAAPMITPMARSTTLPRMMNARKSFHMTASQVVTRQPYRRSDIGAIGRVARQIHNPLRSARHNAGHEYDHHGMPVRGQRHRAARPHEPARIRHVAVRDHPPRHRRPRAGL